MELATLGSVPIAASVSHNRSGDALESTLSLICKTSGGTSRARLTRSRDGFGPRAAFYDAEFDGQL